MYPYAIILNLTRMLDWQQCMLLTGPYPAVQIYFLILLTFALYHNLAKILKKSTFYEVYHIMERWC